MFTSEYARAERTRFELQLRPATVPPAPAVAAVDADRLLGGLAAIDSGLEFIYGTLRDAAERLGRGDVALALDVPGYTRQVFSATRGPSEDDTGGSLLGVAGEGLYVGERRLPGWDAAVAACKIALRLDLALHDAAHDALTGLHNRRTFDEALIAALAEALRHGRPFVVVLFDIDRFKSINDRFGHAAGDDVLVVVANALRAQIRTSDVAARFGGDEFALILSSTNADLVEELMGRVHAATIPAIPDPHLTFSYGAARAPEEGATPHDLLVLADKRLYECKAARRS